MENFGKKWKYNDVYNFNVEFNRIESYNKYIEYWINYYVDQGYYDTKLTLEHKTNWEINDIVDLKDFNRVKGNMNALSSILNPNESLLSINSTAINQTFNQAKANELERKMQQSLDTIGDVQTGGGIPCGLALCGSSASEIKLDIIE